MDKCLLRVFIDSLFFFNKMGRLLIILKRLYITDYWDCMQKISINFSRTLVLFLGLALMPRTHSLHAMAEILNLLGGGQQPAVNMSDADRAELDAITRECDEVMRDQAIGDDEMARLRVEMDRMIEELATRDPRPFGEFQNKVLVDIRLPEVNADYWARALRNGPGHYNYHGHNDVMFSGSIQVTGHDLLSAMFITARCGLDYLFLQQLKKYYFHNVLSNFDGKVRQMLEVLSCIEQDEEGELLWDSNGQKLIQDAFMKEFFPSEATSLKVTMLFGLYFLVSECCRNLKDRTLSLPWTGLIDYCRKKFRAMERMAEEGRRPRWVVSSALHVADGYVLGGESSIVLDTLPTVRKYALLFSGYNYAFLQSSSFEAIKRSLILARFSSQTKYYFQSKTKSFIQKRKDTLCALISSLAYARADEDPELQKMVMERLKKFILESCDYSFFQWVRFKGSCTFWSTLWTELLLLLPPVAKAGVKIYKSM